MEKSSPSPWPSPLGERGRFVRVVEPTPRKAGGEGSREEEEQLVHAF